MNHRTLDELQTGLAEIHKSPGDHGVLELIVRRPRVEERETPDSARLDTVEGLVGDNWLIRGSKTTPDGSAHPGKQLTMMNSRLIALVAGERARWPLAGDQLFVDLDLSEENLPAGTRLRIGSAVVEITPDPHTGCKKFASRYGVDAVRFVSSTEARRLRLRGVYAKVVQSGDIRTGDKVAIC
jgi:hypothetical protein